MNDRIEVHKRRLQKRDEDNELEDKILKANNFQNHWGTLMKKGD